MKKKQILAVLMVIAFIIAALPMSAMAAEGDPTAAETAIATAKTAVESATYTLTVADQADNAATLAALKTQATEAVGTTDLAVVVGDVTGSAAPYTVPLTVEADATANPAVEETTGSATISESQIVKISDKELTDAITEAKGYVSNNATPANSTIVAGCGIVKSDNNGTDVPKTQKWVSQAAITALGTAINTAEDVDTSTATQAEINSAATALSNALSTFLKAATPGTQAEIVTPDVTALTAAIDAAKEYIAVTAGSPVTYALNASNPDGLYAADANSGTNGNKVSKDDFWVSQDAVDTLGAAITAAETVKTKANNNEISQPVVNTAVTTLNTALQTFLDSKQPGALEVSFTKLNTLIATAQDLLNNTASAANGDSVAPSAYWAPSSDITSLTNAITAAQAVLPDGGSPATEQQTVDNAEKTLQTAIDVFNSVRKPGISKLNYVPLEEKIAEAEKLLEDTVVSADGTDVADTLYWATLANTNTFKSGDSNDDTLTTGGINAAKLALTNAADQDAIATAVGNLTDDINRFKGNRSLGSKFDPDYTALQAAIQKAQAAVNGVVASTDGKDVAPSFQWATQSALDAINKAILTAQTYDGNANKSTSQQVIDDATAALNEAIEAFKPQPGTNPDAADYAELVSTLAEANNKIDGVKAGTPDQVPIGTKCATQEAIDAFKDAIDDAQAVADNGKASQDQVDTAMLALKSAILAFKPVDGEKDVDFSALEEAIKNAQDALANVQVSPDGADVPTTSLWAPQAAITALEDAIATAQGIIDTIPAPDQTGVGSIDEATDNLNKAIDVFKASTNNGTMQAPPALDNTVNEGSGLTFNAGQVSGLSAADNSNKGTTASDLTAKFTAPEGYTVQVVKNEGDTTPYTGIVGTGMLLEMLDSTGAVVDTQTIIVTGDLTGVGTFSNQSLAILANATLGGSLTPIQFAAADMNEDGASNQRDLAIMAYYYVQTLGA